jgi:hypothetical protein
MFFKKSGIMVLKEMVYLKRSLRFLVTD